jgi:hypothetical protein
MTTFPCRPERFAMMPHDELEPNPSSPAGQIETTGAFAQGLTELTGWRRQLARWGLVAVLATPFVLAILDQVTGRS